MIKKFSYWMDVEIKRRKGHIKYFVGDGGSLVVEMRKPAKVFIVRSWYWEAPGFKMKIAYNKYFKKRKLAEKFYREVIKEF